MEIVKSRPHDAFFPHAVSREKPVLRPHLPGRFSAFRRRTCLFVSLLKGLFCQGREGEMQRTAILPACFRGGVFMKELPEGIRPARKQKTKGLPGEPGRPECAVVTPERVELSTYCLGGSRSIQLSYGVVLCCRYAEVLSVSTRRGHDSSSCPSVDNRRSVWKRIQARACALFFRRFSDEA